MKGVECLSMSLLRYFVKANVVPTAEETGIGKKPTAEANKRVAEILRTNPLFVRIPPLSPVIGIVGNLHTLINPYS